MRNPEPRSLPKPVAATNQTAQQHPSRRVQRAHTVLVSSGPSQRRTPGSGRSKWRLPLVLVLFNITVLTACIGIVISHNYFLPYTSVRAAKEITYNPEDPVAAFFGNVVLVININYESVAIDTTRFWRRFYSRFFRRIVVLCKTAIPEAGVEAASLTYPESYGMWNGTFWGYHYAALPRLLKRYKDAEGILWTNDDVMINYWNLLKANKSKLWLPNDPLKEDYKFFRMYSSDENLPDFDDWGNDTVYMEQAYHALHSLPAKYQLQYWDSTGGLKVYHKRVCDLFYIPQRHFLSLSTDLFPAVLESRMMSEMGIPLAFYAVENPSEWDHILDDMVFNWELLFGTNKSYDPRDHWNPNISALHPWKIASLRGKMSLLETTALVDPSVRALFPYYLPRNIFEKFHDHVNFFIKEIWDSDHRV